MLFVLTLFRKEEYEQQLAEIERNIERLDKREVWVDND